MINMALGNLGDTMSRMFYSLGYMCASHPWEVIVTFLTLSIYMISMGTTVTGTSKVCAWNSQCNLTESNPSTYVVIMTITRCLSLLYICHQFRSLYKSGSKYLVGIAGLFVVFSGLVFSSIVLNFLDGSFSELNKALPFFLLLIDLSKAGLLAQFALSASSQQEVRDNIARGMAVLGPNMTLDTIVKTLVIGVGTLSGVKKLEEISCFACKSVVVNYIVFMTFFPACLSLVLELSRDRDEGRPVWQLDCLIKVLQQEEEQKPNPVILKVKVIMSAGLMWVHTASCWLSSNGQSPIGQPDSDGRGGTLHISRDPSILEYHLQRWLSVGLEQVVTLASLGAVCILVVKYVFFENKDDFEEHLIANSVLEQPKAIVAPVKQDPICKPSADTLKSFGHSPLRKDSTLGASRICLRRSSTYHTPFFFIGGSEPTAELADKETQTEVASEDINDCSSSDEPAVPARSLEMCLELLNSEGGPNKLTNEELINLIRTKHLAAYKLESMLTNLERAVEIRRRLISESARCNNALDKLPYVGYDYSRVMGSCCENVVGYMPIPVGIAGPLLLDGKLYHIPMATTEGCLVASTNRGCRALTLAGGVHSRVIKDGMTRAPVVELPSAKRAVDVLLWLKKRENFEIIKEAFDSTSRYAQLRELDAHVVAKYVYIRFVSGTGDAMGMNMVSKGTEVGLNKLLEFFPEMEVISLSGNCCADKKATAVNWLEGRGKSVVCDAVVPAKVVRDVLKTSVNALVKVNTCKNLVGSAMAGSIGGFNAQAANIVTAVFIATGQDPAQNVSSSNCITLIQSSDDGDLYISCTMPSIEVGTVGGGTILEPQAACLELLGVRGSSTDKPGRNSSTLARIVCGGVLAGELSLLSALAAGHLVKSHMKHNRSAANVCSDSTATVRTSS